MRRFLTAGAVALAASPVLADLCSLGSELIDGNYYCAAVNSVQYQNFGASGSYNQITNMDSTTGACSSTPFSYSGSLAPFNGELSAHFRGPLQLKQFAYYQPSTSQSKRSSHLAHRHSHLHKRNKEIIAAQEKAEMEKRDVGDWVTATINGVVVSWINQYAGGASPSVATPAPAPAPAAEAAVPTPYVPPTVSGGWVRAGYYDSNTSTSEGITFLNNMGGQGSGVFDYTFGNSLSYASSDAATGAAGPQVLEDMQLPSNTEIIIMTDQSCDDSEGCGYVRPGTVAYHGFGGAEKIFLAEFAMPYDGDTGFNGDMPAFWFLNAQIPRTIQYGPADCSCWTSGCGEADVFEVLTSGSSRAKSTIHAGISGGDSDYFNRPTTPIKLAVAMMDETMTIKIIPDSFNFGESLTSKQVQNLLSNIDHQEGLTVSLFNLGS